jgi:amino acid adenylation domain-containing protein
MSEMNARLAQLSAEERALLFEKLRRRKEQDGRSAPDAGRQPIPRRADPGDPAPLSFAQQRLWFLDRLSPGEPSYNIPSSVIVDGPLDGGSLRRAVQAVVDRHESLRTTFGVVDGAPVQIVAPHLEGPLCVIDLSVAGDPHHPEVLRVCAALFELPFDLAAGPLLRIVLLHLGARRHVLMQVIHHIVSDGWSMNLLVDDLVAFSRSVALPPLPVQYADYALWQRERLGGERLEALMAGWRQRLGDLPAALSLPTDRPRPPVKSPAGADLPIPIDAEADRRLHAVAREEGITPFMLLLAVYQLVLARWSGQEVFAVGSVVAGRSRRELERLIGLFANTLALRADLRGGSPGALTVRELLVRIREATLEAFAHQDVPFEKLVEELRPVRDPSRTPIYQVSLSLQNTPPAQAVFEEIALSALEIPIHYAKYDMEAGFDYGVHGELRGFLVYSAALFDAATAARMIGHFRTLLDGVLDGRERPIADLPLLTAAEARQLAAWNEAQFPGEPLPLIPPEDRFAALAAEAPGAPAVVAAAGTVTRGALDAAADRLARRLRRLGVGPEVPVGVVLPRSPELVLAALAVARSGGAYLPLDPAYPAERIASTLADAGAPVLLTGPGAVLPAFAGTVIRLDGQDFESKDGKDEEPAFLPSFGDDTLAYVIYTSGSTGRPKGVGARRGALAHLTAFTLRVLPVGTGDRATLIAGPAFDGSVWELWYFLSSGAALHLPDEETRLSPARLAEWMRRERITAAFLPTPLAEALLAEPAAAGLPLRFLTTGGDRLHRISRTDLPFPVINCYGPSEATVMTSCALDDAAGSADRDPPVGRPIDGAQVWLLDAALRPVPVGVPGELWIGGGTLARGYLGRPGLTAAAYRPDPFAAAPGARLYRTGDLARWRPDGQLEVLGRLDGQVKVRGFRVETGEVEAVLTEHPAVRQAVVLPRGGVALVAFLVVDLVASEEADDDELRAHLRRRLPEFMVPALFVRLPALPLTPSGKVDRAVLDRHLEQLAPSTAGAGTAPRSATERALAAIWAEVLGRGAPGVEESFFDLGGHSLLLTRLQARIAEQMGREVALLTLIEHPTIAAFAVWLERGLEGEAATSPAPAASRDRAERQRQALELQRQRLTRRPPTR